MYKFFDKVQEITATLCETYSMKEPTKNFYKQRINNFFRDYMSLDQNENKPLDAITYYDIDIFLNNIQNSYSEILNHYNSLKRFFEFTYLKGITREIISQVNKPIQKKRKIKTLDELEYKKIKDFIVCDDFDINERLMLGLFLFTGLSRQYIANIVISQFIFDEGIYKLSIWKDNNEFIIPLKTELQLIIHKYMVLNQDKNKFNKIYQYSHDSYLSEYIGKLVKQIVGKKHTPTTLINTFINRALSNGNYVWEISKLTLESVSTIEKHILSSKDLFNKQMYILNSF